MRTRDADLHRRVLDELESDAALSDQEIGISVHGLVAALSGHVDTYEHKFAAERVVCRVPGITAVAIDLRVVQPGSHDCTDSDIARGVADYLRRYFDAPHNRVVGKVERGWVTLVGEVDFERQRTAVEESVGHISGVRGVVNMISVKHPSGRATAAEYEVATEHERP